MARNTIFYKCLVVAALLSQALAAMSQAKIAALSKLSLNHVIPLNDRNYLKLLEGKRDYNLVVYLTSTSKNFDCMLCRQFEPHIRIVADSYHKLFPKGVADDNKNVYFAIADFELARKYFAAHKVDNIPKILHYPPGSDEWVSSATEYSFLAGDHNTLVLDWVLLLTNVRAKIYVPVDWSQVTLNAAVTFAVVLAAFRFRGLVFQALTTRSLWSALSMVSLLLLTCGYMFNQIRAVPYVQATKNGPAYIIPGQAAQVAAETQIVSFFYGFLSILVIALVKRAPKVTNDAAHLVTVTTLVACIFVMYSGFLNVFAIKVSGYPILFLKLFKL